MATVSAARTTTGRPGRTAEWPRSAVRALAAVRVLIGFVFLWAFLDKTVGLGYATPSERAWVNGGSPTSGYLNSLEAGPFSSAFHSIAGAAWADWLFMVGLLGIGVALLLGIGMRIAAVSATVQLLLMWVAEWPPARFTPAGEPTSSVNPLVDYHLVYAVAVIALAFVAGAGVWRLGRRWAQLPVVQRNRWLI